MKFVRKPIVIEAIQLTPDSFDQCCCFIGEELLSNNTSERECCIAIITPEGTSNAFIGDWIIKGVLGECYPCVDSVFKVYYEKVEEN